jgi:hypothetical protein
LSGSPLVCENFKGVLPTKTMVWRRGSVKGTSDE